MAGTLQPLDDKFPIVDAQGRPTLYFTKWAQQRQLDLGTSITLSDLEAFLTAHKLKAAFGITLTPDGDINNSPSIGIANGVGLNFDAMHNLKLADTAVTPGTYGDATHVAQITVDQQGRITGVALVAISGGGGALTSMGFMSLNSTVSPGVNNYLTSMLVPTDNFTINKVAFWVQNATATTKLQPFVYASNATQNPAALLATGPQVTGVVAGLNEIPLTAPLALTRGTAYFIGVNPITAGLSGLYNFAGVRGGFFANGGSTVPAATAPSPFSFGQPYGFWAT